MKSALSKLRLSFSFKKITYRVVVQSLSHVRLFVTPWTVARQPSLSITITCPSPSPVHHHHHEFAQTHVHWIGDVIQPSHPLLSPALPAFSLSSFGVFSNESDLCIRWPKYQTSASASDLAMNIQDWFPLGLTGLISLQSKGLWRVYSNPTVQKNQFFGAQFSSQSNSHIHTWLLEKP